MNEQEAVELRKVLGQIISSMTYGYQERLPDIVGAILEKVEPKQSLLNLHEENERLKKEIKILKTQTYSIPNGYELVERAKEVQP